MKWLSVLLTSLLLTVNATANDNPHYDGTRASLISFLQNTGIKWPVPNQLDWTVTPDGTRLRYASWLVADRSRVAGTVVYFSGRTEFIEKNSYTYSDLLALHYDVWTFDWRGQGLSDRKITQFPDRGHIDSFDTYVKDADWLIDNIVQIHPQKPRILLAHSMGGAVATRLLQKKPTLFDRAILVSPMLGLTFDFPIVRSTLALKQYGQAGTIRCATNLFGQCSWKSNVKPSIDSCHLKKPLNQAMFHSLYAAYLYSHDLQKLMELNCIIQAEHAGGQPTANLGLGKPTNGWVEAAFNVTDDIFRTASTLQTPTLIVAGGADKIVSNSAQQNFCKLIPEHCCRKEIAGASHEVLIETEPKRRKLINWLFEFVTSPQPVAQLCGKP